ncbi:MAG: TraR/DksA C4-type zinc finger protein [Gemmatimonadetes bacterium]|nr:TraR/DksA C4-type zinc finger protein [Gemmatimonadota bacterium]
MLSKEDRERVERRLQEERARALEALGDFDEQRAESLQERAGELNSYRLHQADLGTEAIDQETQFLLASGQGDRLYQIDDALRRLYDDPDSFGACRECGKTISIERLDVVPETDLCAVHANAAEG